MINLRKVVPEKEPIRNCTICDITSTSLRCSEMFETISDKFDTKNYICFDCINELFHEYFKIKIKSIKTKKGGIKEWKK